MTLNGNPTGTPYYPGQERFSDGAFNVLDREDRAGWTPESALRVLGIPNGAEPDRDLVLERASGAMPAAVAVLAANGYPALDPES